MPELADIFDAGRPGAFRKESRDARGKILTNAAGVNRKVSAPEENPRSVAPAQRS